MLKPLTLQDIDKKVHSIISDRNYSPKPIIQGVKLIHLERHTEEDGDFCEILRVSEKGAVEQMPAFKIAQLNRSKHNPSIVKAWHLQLRQDMLWYVSSTDHLFVGLWDIRSSSKTKGKTMRIVLGGGNSTLLFIPRGVAHGSANFIDRTVDLYYVTNKHFNPKQSDEKRLPWDFLGADFWTPSKE